MQIKHSVKVNGNLFRPGVTDDVLKRATKETLEGGKRLIQKATPVDTGLLRKSWQTNQARRMIYNEIPYSVWVEGGTRRMAARRMAGNSIPAIERLYQERVSHYAGRLLN
jgi:hypothetical protein